MSFKDAVLEGEGLRETPVSQPVFIKALIWSLVATVLIALIMGGVGFYASEMPGLYGGILGGGAAGVFFALTLLSIVLGNKFAKSDVFIAAFFGIVMGGWVLKFIVFLVAAVLLKEQAWLDSTIFFLSVIAGVLVSLVIDMVVVLRSRIPVVAIPEE